MKQPTYSPTQIDLGSDHWMRWLLWDPDLELNPQYKEFEALIKEHPIVGAIVGHKCQTESGVHEGGIYFHTPVTDTVAFKEDTKWKVNSWEPLDIEPSLQAHCPCKDHGHIRQGRWVRA